MSHKSYFSVRYDSVLVGTSLPYDIFINSSSMKDKEHFVRIFAKGAQMTSEERDELHHKYFQFYILEEQRKLYLDSMVQSTTVNDTQKATVIKDCAVEYLGKIFDKKREYSTELLEADIEGCREVVGSMVDLLGNYGVDGLRGLIGNLSYHDFYTYDHSINVSMYSITIWRQAHPKASREDLVNIGLGGLLHDLGKVKVPTHILNSPEGLTDEEYAVIKKHPDFGLELLVEGKVKVHPSVDVNVIGRIVHEHHENWDGTGYPNKIKGDDIHPMARAVTIADFFDAITTKRSYNQVLHVAEALGVLKKFRGIKLEPALLDNFEKHVDYVKADMMRRNLQLADKFDPTIPWAKLPVEEVKEAAAEFGKIRVLDKSKKS